VIRLGSSFRARTLDAVFPRAEALAQACGISRVTDVTRLDRVGIPVCTSIRPLAQPGSLCVNAGKGFDPLEARVGAMMEAIEYAYAEPRNSRASAVQAPIGKVLASRSARGGVLDLCPLAGAAIPSDAVVPCVEAMDLSRSAALVPAELVFFPLRLPPAQTYFGNNTNGLASGSTVVEATVHGLFEVIERDIASFRRLGAPSIGIDLLSVPTRPSRAIDRLEANGFEMAVESMPNRFGVAWFAATLWERGCLDPLFVAEGFGCHLDPEVALSRAITEAAQSRLTLIHGARDDIDQRVARFVRMPAPRKQSYARTLIARARRPGPARDFSTIPNGAGDCGSLDELLEALRVRLDRAGIARVLRVVLTPPDAPMHVVRIIVPGLENFTFLLPRVGARLARYLAKN
jgi:ribosomal protein S12 methylthiotransferase accessory factor